MSQACYINDTDATRVVPGISVWLLLLRHSPAQVDSMVSGVSFFPYRVGPPTPCSGPGSSEHRLSQYLVPTLTLGVWELSCLAEYTWVL